MKAPQQQRLQQHQRRAASNATPTDAALHRVRQRAGWISLSIGIVVFGGKMTAFLLTRSSAVFSDAMESVVNIAAAAMLVFSLRIAARPADRDHPYGHGKVEFFSAGIEGTLILVAAILIMLEASVALVSGRTAQSIDVGALYLGIFGLLNAFVAIHLLRVGRRTQSVALVADGKHLLADAWTTAGVIVGLGAVWATGWAPLDPLIAILVALNILREGAKLLGGSVKGLMDAADEQILTRITEALREGRAPEWIDVHGLRSWRSGAFLHTDLHLLVPRYLDASQLHAIHEEIERRVRDATGLEGDTVVHFDPCDPRDCPRCQMPHCAVRAAPHRGRHELTVEWCTRPEDTYGDGFPARG